MDWTTVAVGLVTAGAGVGGGLGAAWVQGRAADRQARDEHRRLTWSERRDAYMDLLMQVERLRAAADGAIVTTGRMSSEKLAPAFLAAQVRAEFFASAEAWASMEPLVKAAALRMNAVGGAPPQKVELVTKELRELGAHTSAGWDKLWDQYLAAARAELGLTV